MKPTGFGRFRLKVIEKGMAFVKPVRLAPLRNTKATRVGALHLSFEHGQEPSAPAVYQELISLRR